MGRERPKGNGQIPALTEPELVAMDEPTVCPVDGRGEGGAGAEEPDLSTEGFLEDRQLS